MSEIGFGKICLLIQYLEGVWITSHDQQSRYAGILISELDCPNYNPQSLDQAYLAKLLPHIANDGQADLVNKAAEKCLFCAQFDNCAVGTIFQHV